MATFYVEPLAAPGDLHITELNYHPYPASAAEKAAGAALAVPRDLSNPDLFEFVEPVAIRAVHRGQRRRHIVG